MSIHIDQLCNTRRLVELKQQQALWDSQADDKAEDLRQLVGKSYTDLLVSADLILEMETLSENLLEELSKVQDHYLNLGDIATKPTSLEKVTIERAEEIASLIFEAPEQIFNFLDQSKYLDAVSRYLEISVICSQLTDENHIVRRKFEEMKITECMLVNWSTVSSLKEMMLLECQAGLDFVECSHDNLIFLLSGIFLLQPTKWNGFDLCQTLLESRKDIIEHVLNSLIETLDGQETMSRKIFQYGMKTLCQMLADTSSQTYELFGPSDSLQSYLEEYINNWEEHMTVSFPLFPLKNKIDIQMGVDDEDWSHLSEEWNIEVYEILEEILPRVLSLCHMATFGAEIWTEVLEALDPKTKTWNTFFHEFCTSHIKEIILSEFAQFQENHKLSEIILAIGPARQTTKVITEVVEDFSEKLLELIANIEALLSLDQHEKCPKKLNHFIKKKMTPLAQRKCIETLNNIFEGIKEIDLMALDAKVVSNQAMFLACVLQSLLPKLHKLEGFLTPGDVEELCHPLEIQSVSGFSVWSQWLSDDLRIELEKNLRFWIHKWQKPEIMQKCWIQIHGPDIDDPEDIILIPQIVSSYVHVFLFNFTGYMLKAHERLGNIRKLSRETKRTISDMLIDVFTKFLEEHEDEITESCGMQWLIDYKFLFHVLGKHAQTEKSKEFLKRILQLVDSLIWSYCGPHVEKNVKIMLARTCLLYGHSVPDLQIAGQVDTTNGSKFFPRTTPINHIPLLPIAREPIVNKPMPKIPDFREMPFSQHKRDEETDLQKSVQELKTQAVSHASKLISSIWGNWGGSESSGS